MWFSLLFAGAAAHAQTAPPDLIGTCTDPADQSTCTGCIYDETDLPMLLGDPVSHPWVLVQAPSGGFNTTTLSVDETIVFGADVVSPPATMQQFLTGGDSQCKGTGTSQPSGGESPVTIKVAPNTRGVVVGRVPNTLSALLALGVTFEADPSITSTGEAGAMVAVEGDGLLTLENGGLQGAGLSACLTAEGADVYIQNASGTPGFDDCTSNLGGAISVDDTNLYLSGVLKFRRNEAASAGGAIHAHDSEIWVDMLGGEPYSNLILTDNQAQNGGAVSLNNTPMWLNTPMDAWGNVATRHGGAFALRNGASVLATNTDGVYRIANNEALDLGGGLWIDDSDWTSFGQVNAYENEADRGGAIAVTGGQFRDHPDFENQTAQSTYWQNRARIDGGVFYLETGSTLELRSPRVTDNDASAAFASGGQPPVVSGARGGAIFADGDATNLVIVTGATSNVPSVPTATFERSYADGRGGAIAMVGGRLILQPEVATDVPADTTGATDFPIVISGSETWGVNGSLAQPGALFLRALQSADIRGTWFDGNIVHAQGGSPHGLGGAIHIEGVTNTDIEDSRFSTNEATGGGALYVSFGRDGKPTVDISRTTFDYNVSSFDAGAILVHSGIVTLDDVHCLGNVAEVGGCARFVPYKNDSRLTLRGATVIENNTATYGGGVSYFTPVGLGFLSNPVLELRGVTFLGNRGLERGSAIAGTRARVTTQGWNCTDETGQPMLCAIFRDNRAGVTAGQFNLLPTAQQSGIARGSTIRLVDESDLELRRALFYENSSLGWTNNGSQVQDDRPGWEIDLELNSTGEVSDTLFASGSCEGTSTGGFNPWIGCLLSNVVRARDTSTLALGWTTTVDYDDADIAAGGQTTLHASILQFMPNYNGSGVPRTCTLEPVPAGHPDDPQLVVPDPLLPLEDWGRPQNPDTQDACGPAWYTNQQGYDGPARTGSLTDQGAHGD